MKRFRKTFVSIVLICLMVFVTACDNTPAPPPGDVTAAYKTEYYLEGDNGYALDASKGETLSGTVGSTVTIDKKTIDGYYFESDHESNALRGKVLADGSLVLKAYYSKDYTGRVTFETEHGNSIDMLKGSEKDLDVTVKVDGVAVTQGITYSSSYKVISIDANGKMEAKMRGEADVTVKYRNISKTYRVTAYDKFIETEEDWWSIYDHLGYWYKFTNDVVLTKSTEKHFEVVDEAGKVTTPGYTVNHNFEGVIDGGGHSLTYGGTRLFNWVSGDRTVIRNITLNASEGFYWGSSIAFGIDNKATVDNVTLNAEFVYDVCQRYASEGNWIKCGGDDGVDGNGGMFATMDNCTITNCTVNLDITAIKNTAPFGGIAYSAVNSVVKDCTINSTDDTISVIAKADTTGSTITDCEVNPLQLEEKEQILIETEEDFWAIYESKAALAGNYKLANDITLHVDDADGNPQIGSITLRGEDYKINHNFRGTIDGDGHKLTYSGGRLFHTITNGTIKNITLDAGKGYYYGSALAFTITGNSTLKDIVLNAEIDRGNTYQYVNGELGASNGSGVFGVWVSSSTIEDCTANVTFTGDAIAAVSYYSGIAFDLATTTVTNVMVNSNKEIGLYKSGAGNEITNSKVEIVYNDDFTMISTEADWWAIYSSSATLDGKYRFANDITLTREACAGEESKINYVFTGEIDGNGKKLNYTGSRLFYEFHGKMENLTLNAGAGYYWGSALAFTIKNGAVLKGLTIDVEFNRADTNQHVAGQDFKADGAGVFSVWFENSTIENCIVDVTFSGDAVAVAESYYSAVAFSLTGSTVTNLKVSSTKGIKMNGNISDTTNTITDSSILVPDADGVISISTEADWWAIYASETSLAGKYKFANNITLTRAPYDNESGKTNHNFTGEIDGNGMTLTYSGSRLFYEFHGKMQNLTLNAGSGYYWGCSIAYTIKAGAILKGLTINMEFNRADTHHYVGGVDYTADAAGGLCVWLENSTIEDCEINITLSGDATSAYYYGVGTHVSGVTLKNITVNCASLLTAYKDGTTALEENVVCNVTPAA